MAIHFFPYILEMLKMCDKESTQHLNNLLQPIQFSKNIHKICHIEIFSYDFLHTFLALWLRSDIPKQVIIVV